MRFRLAIYTVAVLSAVVPITVSAQGRGGLNIAADSIKAKYRPAMQKLYYNPKKFKTYLEQLGITYPTVRKIVQ